MTKNPDSPDKRGPLQRKTRHKKHRHTLPDTFAKANRDDPEVDETLAAVEGRSTLDLRRPATSEGLAVRDTAEDVSSPISVIRPPHFDDDEEGLSTAVSAFLPALHDVDDGPTGLSMQYINLDDDADGGPDPVGSVVEIRSFDDEDFELDESAMTAISPVNVPGGADVMDDHSLELGFDTVDEVVSDLVLDRPDGVSSSPRAGGSTGPHDAVPANWTRAVAGLRIEATRAPNSALRAILLTTAAHFQWQLVGDHDDAHHLLQEALQAESSVFAVHREQALLRLRDDERQDLVFSDLAQGVHPRDRYDSRRKLRGRLRLYAGARAVLEDGPGPRPQAAELVSQAEEDLEGGLDWAIWSAYQARLGRRDDFSAFYLHVISLSKEPRLRAAFLVDLASGILAGTYRRPPGTGAGGFPTPWELLREALELVPDHPAYDAVWRRCAAGELAPQLYRLKDTLRASDRLNEALRVRASAIAETLGEVAIDVLIEIPASRRSAPVLWRLFRAAVHSGELDVAEQIGKALKATVQDDFGAALLALERASLHAAMNDRAAMVESLREAFQLQSELLTPRVALGREFHLTSSFRDLMDLRGFELATKASNHIRRAEILESRLSSPLEAEADYREALAQDPADIIAFRSLERLLTYADDATGLRDLYIERVPHTETFEQRADVILSVVHLEAFVLGQPAQAAARLIDLLETRPQAIGIKRELVELCMRLGETQEATLLLDELIEATSDPEERALLLIDRLNQLHLPVDLERLSRWRELMSSEAIFREQFESVCLRERDFSRLADFVLSTAKERDGALLAAHTLTQCNDSMATTILRGWLTSHPDDFAAKTLLVEAGRKLGDFESVREIWHDGRHLGQKETELASAWRGWWDGAFGFEDAKRLSEAAQADHEKRVIWTVTLFTATSASDRTAAVLELLSVEPADVRLRSLAEAEILNASDGEALLELYASWTTSAQGVDRDHLLHQLARCYLDLDRASDALTLWRKLSQLHPDFVPARVGQLFALLKCGQTADAKAIAASLVDDYDFRPDRSGRALYDLLSKQVDTTDGAVRLLTLLELCDVAERADERGAALRFAARALAAQPSLESAQRRQIRLAASESRPDEAGALHTDAELVAVLTSARETAKTTDIPMASLESFLAALGAGPDPELLGVMLAAGRRSNDAALLSQTLRYWSDGGRDPGLLLEIDLGAAEFAEISEGRLDLATFHYRRAWDRQPQDPWIAAQLARCAPSEDETVRARLVVAASEGRLALSGVCALARQLEPAAAAELYCQSLNQHPDFLPCEWGLIGLDRMLIPPDVLERRGRRRRCSRLVAEAAGRHALAGDSAAAEELCYEALGFSFGANAAAFGSPFDCLVGVLLQQNRGVELIALGEDLVTRSQSRPGKRRLLEGAVYLSVASSRSRRVTRRALGQLIQLNPRNRALLRRSIALAVDSGEWGEVASLLEREKPVLCELYPRLDAIVSWEIGEIQRTMLDQPNKALASFRDAGDKDGSSLFLQTAISRLLLDLERWDDWVEFSLAPTAAAEANGESESAAKQAKRHVSVAALFEFHVPDQRRALSHYQTAFTLDPNNRSAAIGAVRVAERSGRPTSAVTAMEAISTWCNGATGHSSLLRAAELSELVRRNYTHARELYEKLEVRGEGRWAAAGLEACREAMPEDQVLDSELVRLLTSDGEVTLWDSADQHEPVVWAGRLFRRPGSGERSASSAARGLAGTIHAASTASELLRFALFAGAHARTALDTQALHQLANLDPSDPLPLLLLETSARPGSEQERWSIDARIRAASHGLGRAHALASLVTHHAVRHDLDALWDALERIKIDHKELPLTEHVRAALSVESEDPQLAAERYEAEAAASPSRARRVELFMRAAKLRRRQLGQIDRAIEDLLAALAVDAMSEDAFTELRDLYVTQGKLDSLYELLEFRFQALDDPAKEIATLGRMAELAFDRLKDRTKAVWCHEQIVQRDSNQIRSYRILAEIYLEGAELERAADMLEAVVEHSEQPSLLHKTHIELARLYLDKLSRAAEAERHFRASLRLKADYEPALSAMAEMSEDAERWDDAARFLLKVIEHRRRRTPELFLRYASALERSGGDKLEIQAALRQAVAVDPAHPDAIDRLSRFAGGRETVVAPILKQVATRFATEDKEEGEGESLGMLVELFDKMGRARRSYVVSSIMKAFGYQTDWSEAVRGAYSLRPNHWIRLKSIPAERTTAVFPKGLRAEAVALIRAVDTAMSKVFPARTKQLGASRKNRLSRNQAHPTIAVADLLGRPDVDVFTCLAPGSLPILEPGANSPSLLVASDFDVDATDDGAVWQIANAVAPAAMGMTALSRLPADVWAQVMVHVIRVWVPGFLERDGRAGAPFELAGQVRSALRKAPADLAASATALATLDFDGLQVQNRLLKVAFASLACVPCQDVSLALREVIERGPGAVCARAVVPFLLSVDFETLQQSAFNEQPG